MGPRSPCGGRARLGSSTRARAVMRVVDDNERAIGKAADTRGQETAVDDGLTDRHFDWDTNPHIPRLYSKPAPPLHLPRHNDGLHDWRPRDACMWM